MNRTAAIVALRDPVGSLKHPYNRTEPVYFGSDSRDRITNASTTAPYDGADLKRPPARGESAMRAYALPSRTGFADSPHLDLEGE
jgi:hypothetical protein